MIVDNTEFMKKLMDHKMLTVKAEENVIRLFPPLIVSNSELDEAIIKLKKFVGNELIMKKFINIADINKKDLRLILDNAKSQEKKKDLL